jgi:hypothetical protein
MTIEHRTTRALDIAAGAGQWIRMTDRETGGRRLYRVTSAGCTCPDRGCRGLVCKHMRAVRAFEATSADPAPVAAPERPQARQCVRCGERVRPESIYAACEDCVLLYGGALFLSEVV